MRLIDADKLRHDMYDAAFIQDSDMQKWDGGCWIRYRLFEKTLDNEITIDAVEVVRCKDCIALQHCRFTQGLGLDGFCSKGERREG